MQIIKRIKVLFLLVGIAVVCNAQIQIGDELQGEFKYDYFGESVSMSADGQVVAIGSYRDNVSSKRPGYVRVFGLAKGAWKQLGNDIVGINEWDEFGFSVALSDDGTKLIAGSLPIIGIARVYEYKEGNWSQVGNGINMKEQANDVAISADGKIVAVGNYNFSHHALHNGAVGIFEWKDGDWAQMGSNIYGEAELDQSGCSISLSADGKTVAIGSRGSDEGGDRSGHVRVFRFVGGEWILLGSSIVGKGSGYAIGWSVSISSSGNRVAINGPGSLYHGSKCCYVAIYDFINGEWTAVGQELNGYDTNNRFGNMVTLSGDGNRFAVLSISHLNCPVRIYDLINGEWKQVGKSIKNLREEKSTIISIGMSRNGNVIAAGTLGGFPRLVDIYDISEINTGENLNDDCEIKEEEEEEIEAFKLYPNPTSGSLTVEGVDLEKLRESKKLHLFDILGRSMGGYEVKENTINLSNLPSGTYFLKLDDRIEKIIVAVF